MKSKNMLSRLSSAKMAIFAVTVFVVILFGAMLLFGEQGSQDTQKLIRDLKSQNREVQLHAAWALGALEESTAVSALLESLKDANPQVRGMAIWALGEIKEKRAISALLMSIEDSNVLVREMAIRSLGELEDRQPTARLIGTLKDPNPEIRMAAVWALGEIGTDKALKAVKEAQRDQNTLVKTMANRVVNNVDSETEIQEEMVLGNQKIGEQVDLALKQIGSHDMASVVNKLEDQDPTVRKAAAYVLGLHGNAQAVKPLIAVLQDADPDVRAMAVWALDEIDFQ